MRRAIASAGLAASVLGLTTPARAAAQHQHPTQESRPAQPAAPVAHGPIAVERQSTLNGLGITLSLAPRIASDSAASPLMAGEDVVVRLSLTDSLTGAPRAGLSIAAWVDHRSGVGATADSMCRIQVQSYLRGSLQFRPAVDLNRHFVVSLNTGNSLSVLDPLVSFSVSQVYAGVSLAGEGEDWALDADGRALFVTLPLVNLVAVVNTEIWEVDTNLVVGQRPTRIVLQPDGRYLWVSDNGPQGTAPGVTIVDRVTQEVVRHLPTGAGPHDIAFAADSRTAFVSSADAGTVTVIDVTGLRVVREIATGPRPIAASFAAASGTVYVVDALDGTTTVIDAVTHEVGSRLEGNAGWTTIRFDPSGRWGFALNAAESEVVIFDASTATVRHAAQFGQAPDQVVFTENFAHVRSSGSTDLAMVALAELAVEGPVRLMPFTAGAFAPDALGGPWPAAGLTPASHHDMPDAVYVASPGDKSVYQFHYMMGMPMAGGRFNAYPFEPKAVLVVSQSLRETEPGVHTATFRAPPAGEYDVVVFVREPRAIRCLAFPVTAAPTRSAVAPVALKLEPVSADRPVAGTPSRVALRLVDNASGASVPDVTDLVVYVTSPTGWSTRLHAPHEGDGVYAVEVTVPAPGVYLFAAQSRRLGTRFESQVPMSLFAVAERGGGSDGH